MIDRTQRAAAWLAAHQTLSAALALGLLLNLCFFPFIWGNRTLLASSRSTHYVPSVMPNGAFFGPLQGPSIRRANDDGAAAWMLEADAPLVRHQYLAEKHAPLWNPYQSYGAPLAANMQSQPFNPLFVLFALDPTPRTFNLFVLFRLFFAGFCAYLYLRLFLAFTPALSGGLVCMLSGYYLLFFNMPHISVEMLVPAIFLATERLLRRFSSGNFLLAVLIVFLSIAGGMPESTLLALTFGYCYFLFRILTDPALRSQARKHVATFILVNVLGFAISAFLLAPFVEFMRVSSDSHQLHNLTGLTARGLRHDAIGPSIATYVTPLIFGTAWSRISPTLGGYAALRGYFGILPVFFGIAAALGLFRNRGHFPGQKRLTLFFLAAAVLVIFKRYGAPLVNSIGDLPLFRLVEFIKYEESLLVFAVAVLCAIGVNEVLIRSDNRRHLMLSLGLGFLVLAAIVVCTLPAISGTKAVAPIYYLSLAASAAVLLAAALVLLPDLAAKLNLSAAAIVLLLAAELSGNYIVPVYYLLTKSATVEADPYKGAPYIDYLRSKLTHQERMFASDGILHPGWAGTFQIGDIRGLDAMYWKKYLPFVHAFLADIVAPPADRRLRDRFTGLDINDVESRLKTRLLQLSSVRYQAFLQPAGAESAFVEDILAQTKGKLAKGRENMIEARRFTIGGETKPVLYEHPPYDRLPLALEITPERRRLSFDVAMQPAVYDGSMPVCGDGVEFRLEVRGSDGRIAPLYSRYIDPKHFPAERRWVPETVDLKRYIGQKVELLFTTTPGPAGDTCADWAGWGDPRFPLERERREAFRLVYDREVKVYEYDRTLPRASLFSRVEVAANEQAVLSRLVDPNFDIFQSAVVAASDVDPESARRLQSIDAMQPVPVQAAAIVSYTSQDVEIEASSDRPTLLMLNDTDYPGWQVYVDGGRSKWITVDYLFRGVPLAAGRHKVRFAYEPASFRLGARIAGVAGLALAIFLFSGRAGDLARSRFSAGSTSGRPLCPICQRPALPRRSTVGAYALRVCRQCRFEFLDPQPEDSVLTAIYSDGYFLGEQSAEAVERRSQMKSANGVLCIDALSQLVRSQDTDLLEIGCGHGELLLAAQTRGFRVSGVEVSAHAAAAANRRLGAPAVRVGTLDEVSPPSGQFGAVVASDVIEHVRDPKSFLMRIGELLAPGGALLLVTPSLDSWTRILLRHHWMEYKIEHLFYFSSTSIRRLLEQCGFEEIRILPNRKVLTIDYLCRHFERFRVPLLSPLMSLSRRAIPDGIAHRHLLLPASGLMAIARKPAGPRACP